jgi:hypothetical protein
MNEGTHHEDKVILFQIHLVDRAHAVDSKVDRATKDLEELARELTTYIVVLDQQHTRWNGPARDIGASLDAKCRALFCPVHIDAGTLNRWWERSRGVSIGEVGAMENSRGIGDGRVVGAVRTGAKGANSEDTETVAAVRRWSQRSSGPGGVVLSRDRTAVLSYDTMWELRVLELILLRACVRDERLGSRLAALQRLDIPGLALWKRRTTMEWPGKMLPDENRSPRYLVHLVK